MGNLPIEALTTDPIADLLLSRRIYKDRAPERRTRFLDLLRRLDRERRENVARSDAIRELLATLLAERSIYSDMHLRGIKP